MADAIDVVLEGKYKGAKVEKGSNGYAYIKLASGDHIYITKGKAKQVSLAGTSTQSAGMAGIAVSSALFGVAGTASALQGIKIALLEIQWLDGGVSLVRVGPTVSEAITIGMYSDYVYVKQTPTNLFSFDNPLHTRGCPVSVIRGNLVHNHVKNTIIATISLKNLSPKEITSVSVEVIPLGPNRMKLGNGLVASYENLSISRGDIFGAFKEIILPDSNTSSFQVLVRSVSFKDGKSWAPQDSTPLTPLVGPTHLLKVFENLGLARQFARDVSDTAKFLPEGQNLTVKFMPEVRDDFWYCTCGAFNWLNEESCYACKLVREELLSAANIDTVRRHKEKTDSKKNKRLAIVALILFICAAAYLTVTRALIPSNEYKAAEALLAAGDYDGAIAGFTELGTYKDAQQRVSEAEYAKADSYYVEAEKLFAADQYDDAIAMFKKAGDHRDAPERILETQYVKAEALYADGNYDAAIACFSQLKDYKDAPDRLLQVKYDKAASLVEEGLYIEAIPLFLEIGDFSDSESQVLNAESQLIRSAKVGDSIYYGCYEQDNDTKTEHESIEWVVLSKNRNRILVISKYLLDYQPYNHSRQDTTWSSCSLRSWLNRDFLSTAFSSEEQKLIPSVSVSTPSNPKHGTPGGKSTSDRIFLLSIGEANKYLSSTNFMTTSPTSYAKEMGATPIYYFRSPGFNELFAASISLGDSVSFSGMPVDSKCGIRPAMWIDLSMIE